MSNGLTPNALESLSTSEVSAITQGAVHKHVEDGQYFFQQGERATHFYMLLEGRAKVIETTPEGKQVASFYVGPGEVFGIEDQHRLNVHRTSAQAVEPSYAMCWETKDLPRLLKAHPVFAINLVHGLTHRLRDLQVRYRDLATGTVEQRIAKELLRLSEEAGEGNGDYIRIGVPLPGPALAELTGTTLYSVSRVLARWKQEGVVVSHKRHLTLCDAARLAAIAADGQGVEAEPEET